jgi:uncharacterized protein YkwD
MTPFQGNWVDLVIILVLLYFASEAWRVGFWAILADFISFLLSLVIALSAYQYMSELLRANFALSHSLSNALGFLLTAIIAEGVLGFILTFIVSKIPLGLWKTKWNKFLGIFPAIGEGLVLITFIITLIIGLPLSPQIKTDVTESSIGGFLVRQTSGIEARLNEIFGGVIEDTLTYLTIRPDSGETIPINVAQTVLSVDEAAESEMFRMVNRERRERGVRELVWEPAIVPVSRTHAEDMWRRGYFGHVSPDGEDVGHRLNTAGVRYVLAGENLALAPTLQTAHIGLMNSEGHRRNILDPEFGRVAIGVIDNGVYGKMFVQVFAD